MLTNKENAFRTALEQEMKNQGATQEEINLITDDLVKNSVKNKRSVKDVAWAILQ